MFRKLMFIILFIVSPLTQADMCGEGKVKAIVEGGWNTDDFFIQLDYSISPSRHPGTEYQTWIRYRQADMGIERFKGIKSLAMAAYFSGKPIWTLTHLNRCDQATELGVR